MRLFRLLPLAFTLAAAASVAAPDDWHALNRQAAAQAKAHAYAGLHDTLAALAPALPGNPTVVYNQAASAAKLGHADEAIAALTRLADAGLAYDLAKDDDFASLAERADFKAVRDRLLANRGAVGTPSRVMAFPDTDWLPESLAWDAATKRLFVSDVRHCEVRVVDDPARAGAHAGASRVFARLPASVFALGLDAKRQRLWATIATVPQAARCGEGPASDERTALLALDPRTGRVLQRVEAGMKGVLGDVLVADDGTVYASESAHGAVLRLRPGARAFERLDVPGDFASPQQPALSADGRTLLVPDYARGVGEIDLANTGPSPARWPANGTGVFSAGIDGLVRDGASLLAVQNGVAPARVIRLSDDLQRQQVLESGTPGLGEPTHAIVVGRQAWFIADAGWDRFDDAGARKPGAPPTHAELRAVPLDPDALVVESELRAATQQYLDAIAPGDVAVWDRLLDPAMLYVDENDVVRTKAQMLEELTPLPKGLEGHLEITGWRMALAGDVAVVTREDAESLDYYGQMTHSRFRTTDTWHRTPAGWRLLGSQVMATQQDPPSVPLDDATLCAYAGRYALTADIVYAARCEGGALVFERPGKPKHTFRPELRDQFFEPGQPRTRRLFQRDAAGAITGFVDRREERDIQWKRVP